jgi:O-antigen ligase
MGRSDALVDTRFVSERIAYLLDHLIWWCALGLAPLVAIPQGGDKLWWLAAFECYAFGLGILWIANGFFKGDWKLRGGSLFIPLLLLAGYAFVQTLPFLDRAVTPLTVGSGRQTISADVAGTYHFLAELLALIIWGKVLLDYTNSRRRLLWLIYVVIAVGVGSAAFGVFRLISQRAWPALMIFGQGQGDGFAQFANRNHFAFMVEMALGLALGLLLGGGVRRQYLILHVGMVLLLAMTIVLTTSRGGVLAMFGQISFLGLWFAIHRMWRNRSCGNDTARPSWRFIGRIVLSFTLVASFILVIAIGIVNLGGEPLTQRMEKLSGEVGNDEDDTQGKRRDIWQATSSLIKAHPFTGSGLGAYYTAIPTFHHASGRDIPLSALSHYLDLMSGAGLLGVGLAVWFMIFFMVRVGRKLKSRHSFSRAVGLGVAGGVFGLAAHSLVESGLQVPINAIVFFALIVIAVADVGSHPVRNPT